ncbi:MAG: nucleotidyltransferase family protein [Acidimicrobiales bacterium]
MTVAGVVLAAGGGRRFAASGGEGSKLLALLDGRPLVAHVLAAASTVGFDELLLVQGAVDLSVYRSEGVRVLVNDRWAEGLATSLQVALAHASGAGHDAVVVGLADQPAVSSAAWAAVSAAGNDPPIAVATYDGHRGNPVRLAATVWGQVPTTGDAGARRLMRERPDLVRAVPCTGQSWDVDTVEDLDRWS